LSGVKALFAGAGTYCAVLTSGGVDCWGKGTYGVLGDGATSDSEIPVAVKAVGGTGALTGVESVVSGNLEGSACAVLTSGGVDCWGANGLGELGDGTTIDSDVPVAVVGVGGTGTLSGVKSVANAGGSGYCALLTSGGVDCWGANDVGQLGNGVEGVPNGCGGSCSTSPAAVVGVGKVGTLSGVASLVGALSSYCALLTSGGVDCWGQGMWGELGDGTNDRAAAPVAVAGVGAAGTLSGVKIVATSGRSYCAVITSGGLDCWGDNLQGELGNGTMTGPESCLTRTGRHPCSTKPVAVNGVIGNGALSTVESVSNGGDSYCALLKSGGLDCWGYNSQGQLGNGTTTSSDIPVYVPGGAPA
jgi:alpha-tubulin suppressor-like RCC1 family protein